MPQNSDLCLATPRGTGTVLSDTHELSRDAPLNCVTYKLGKCTPDSSSISPGACGELAVPPHKTDRAQKRWRLATLGGTGTVLSDTHGLSRDAPLNCVTYKLGKCTPDSSSISPGACGNLMVRQL
jgi:hypothetical protein